MSVPAGRGLPRGEVRDRGQPRDSRRTRAARAPAGTRVYHGPLYCGLALERSIDRRKVRSASAASHLHILEEAARVLELRDTDFVHLTRSGLLTHAETSVSRHNKRTTVPLYRQADLDRILRSKRIDWPVVRATPKGKPSPLAALPTRR
ncbi:hypothetical protein [Streptomyces tsukubensis]|uniref:hypothetical protein n=1 Tax=Streptomyces tsukubensis TaxID=83656 RepID=UPI00344D2B9B